MPGPASHLGSWNDTPTVHAIVALVEALLGAAAEEGWTVVSIADDRARVFADPG